MDVHAVKLAAESVPWVDRASVRRVWPDTLVVEIEEQIPLAYWGSGTATLLNTRGEPFHPAAVPAGLPRLGGPEGMEQVVAARYQTLSRQLAELNLAVVELQLSPRRAWALRLDNGLRLSLGREAGPEALARFVTVYPQVLARQVERMQGVDLRYTNGFSVRWKDET